MGRNIRAPFFIALIALATATPALADHFELKDGKTIDGDVLHEDDKTFIVELQSVGTSFSRKIEKTRIKTWTRPSREGAPYVLIPICGPIGVDITANAVRAGLGEARNAKPSYIVFAIDSPGGSIEEMVGIIDAISDANKLFPTIAYVKTAYSAAAVIAMACQQIYMKPEATIGATVPFRMTEHGPADVDAKFRSVIEARMRAASSDGGHNDLFIRGMSESRLELYLVTEKGKPPQLRTAGPGKLIKSRGQILTLTAPEAVECGLAKLSLDMTDLGKQVCGGPWHEANHRAWKATLNAVASAKAQQRNEIENQMNRARQAYDNQNEFSSIIYRARQLASIVVSADTEIRNVADQSQLALQQIDADYQVELRKCTSSSDAASVTDEANTKSNRVRLSSQIRIAKLKEAKQSAQKELDKLQAEYKDLLAKLPEQ